MSTGNPPLNQTPVLHFLRAGQSPLRYDPYGSGRPLATPPVPAFDFFPFGSATIRQNVIIRSMAFASTIPDFRGLRFEGQLPDGSWPSLPIDKGLTPGVVATDGNYVPSATGGVSQAGGDKRMILLPLDFRSSRLILRTVSTLTLVFGKGPKFPWFPNGHILLGGTEFGIGGALSDFGFWSTSSTDPMDLLVDTATTGVSGTVGNNWTRHYAIVTPPDRARYMAMGGQFGAQPFLNAQSLYAAQVEVAPLGVTTPTTYSDPREIRVIIRPERINWSKNPSFVNNVALWSGSLTRTANAAAPSGFSGTRNVTAGSNVSVTHTVSGLRKGYVYLVKVRVSAAPGLLVRPDVTGAGTAITGTGVDREVGPLGTDLTFLFKQTSTADTVLTFLVKPNVNGVFNVLSALVEETEDTSRTYFDGNTPGDYFWETGQTDGSSRSYYYKNFLARYKTVKSILKSDAPMGVGVADPQYGVPPTN